MYIVHVHVGVMQHEKTGHLFDDFGGCSVLVRRLLLVSNSVFQQHLATEIAKQMSSNSLSQSNKA